MKTEEWITRELERIEAALSTYNDAKSMRANGKFRENEKRIKLEGRREALERVAVILHTEMATGNLARPGEAVEAALGDVVRYCLETKRDIQGGQSRDIVDYGMGKGAAQSLDKVVEYIRRQPTGAKAVVDCDFYEAIDRIINIAFKELQVAKLEYKPEAGSGFTWEVSIGKVHGAGKDLPGAVDRIESLRYGAPDHFSPTSDPDKSIVPPKSAKERARNRIERIKKLEAHAESMSNELEELRQMYRKQTRSVLEAAALLGEVVRAAREDAGNMGADEFFSVAERIKQYIETAELELGEGAGNVDL